jgi:Uncharacterised nucleotidyltransferase
MRLPSSDLVALALRDPESLTGMTPLAWDLLIRQARSGDLLARIGSLLEDRALLADVPAGPGAHLAAAGTLAAAQQDEVRREVAHIGAALRPLAVPVVLLKGAAYVLAELPPALGRTFSDVDVLVPRDRLADVEAALMLAGWASTNPSEYDQQYYRRWMHELPPLQHIRRQTVLDVHHAILPDTARLRPPSGKLFDAARILPGNEKIFVLAPADLVLHSMAHLFHNEEWSHGLRDLSDLDLLLRHFGTTPGFWQHLVARAVELDLARPLYYGLDQTHGILGTPVPTSTLEATRPFAPPWPLRTLMQRLWSHALRSPHASAAGPLTGVAHFALYVRAHWLRMPPVLLARHLAIKAVTRRRAEA